MLYVKEYSAQIFILLLKIFFSMDAKEDLIQSFTVKEKLFALISKSNYKTELQKHTLCFKQYSFFLCDIINQTFN